MITELTLKLHGISEAIAGGICSFPSIEAACNAVIDTIQFGVQVSRIELLDSLQVRACNTYSGLKLPEAPLLLLEFHGTEKGVNEQANLFGVIASDYPSHQFEWTTNSEERESKQARCHWAALSLVPGGVGISTMFVCPFHA